MNETKPLVSNIEYSPFFNIEEKMTWKTSQGDFNHIKTINKDGVITSIVNTQVNGFNLSLFYDNRLNINKVHNSNDNFEISNAYDNRSRIISSSLNSVSPTNYGYSYNTSSDRTSFVKNTNLSTYNYDNNSHKLLNVSGYDNHQYSYDLNGNTITQNNNTFTYNTSNRLAKVTNNSENTDYFYNSFGERYLKHKKTLTNNNEEKNWFIYDGSSLLYEKNESNNIASEYINYIYLNGKPIGIIKNNDIYYIQTDHLGTPRVILDKNNNLLWKWDYSEPFGNNQPIATGLDFNLRFPGQYWDDEKSSSYNINRDYNPITGRYLQSDPLGLEAGINTYGYVEANPLSYIDEDGNMPSLPQGLVDFLAGLGDTLTLNITSNIRYFLDIGNIDNCSIFYQLGETGGVIASISTGALAGLKSVVYNGPKSVQWSHWIPDRYINKNAKEYKRYLDIPIVRDFINSKANGNHVSKLTHQLTDPKAYRFMKKSQKIDNEIYNPIRRQINRIPYWLSMGGLSSLSMINNNCNCNK